MPIRLFEQFVMDFPMINLLLLRFILAWEIWSMSEVSPDEQPTFEQITKARKNYKMVRGKPRYRTYFRCYI